MAAPSGYNDVDVIMSSVHSVPGDKEHPVQKVLFGVKVVSGVPHPVVLRTDANTGVVLKTYLDGSKM